MGVLLGSSAVGELLAPVIASGFYAINDSYTPLILYTACCLLIASIVVDVALGEQSLHRAIYNMFRNCISCQ